MKTSTPALTPPLVDEPVPLSWKRATAYATLVIYSPFVIMAFCTLLFVDCYHCKQTAFILLPCGPGLFPLEFLRSLLSFQSPGDLYWFATAFLFTLGEIFLLASLLRRGGWFLRAGMATAFIIFSIIAYCTLSMIRA
ncbi:MAG: hypothetical protein K0Q55_1236 [Verrucomicrobia bacterium]|nr:hypothetical protein [Verrucomicrobiota bacterium]